MTNENEMRKQKKEALRRSMVSNDRVRLAITDWLSRNRRPVLAAGAALLLLVLIAAVWMLVHRYLWRYTTYEVRWAAEVSNASAAGYMTFGEGFVVLNRDGVSCYSKSGTQLWSCAYDMRSPVAATEAGYLLVYDQGGKEFFVCDRNGKVGSGTTSLPITKGDVASTGVCVLQTEDTQASLITYYRSSGEELQVSIRTPAAANGYPLDLSLSPGGQQLAVSYYYMSEGSGKCRVDFYDFEKGTDIADRIVGSFDYQETDTYVPEVVYLTDTLAFAIGDNLISFFDCSGRTRISRRDVAAEGEIQRVFYNNRYLGLVTEGQEETFVQIYTAEGREAARFGQDTVYDCYLFQGKNVVMYDAGHFRIETFSGRVRFDKDFGNSIYAVMPAEDFGGYYLATMDEVQRIRLK